MKPSAENREIERRPFVSFGRAAAVLFSLVAIGLAVAAIVNAPLSYDGAFHFFQVVDNQEIRSGSRPFNAPLQLPTVVATHLIHNLAVLRLIYSICYVTVPALALAAAWIVCGPARRSWFVWPALSICLAALPGQFAFHAEGIHGTNLLWPALLFALGDMSAAHLPLVLMLAVWSWGAYAAMALHFMVVAIAAFWSALIRPAVRLRGMMFGAAMILMAVTRLLKPIGPYGKKILGLGVFQFTFYSAVLGWPLLSALMTLIAGAALLWSLRSLRSAATAARIATTAIVLGGVCLVPWAIRPGNWIDAQGYRFWYPAIAVVLMFGAMAEATWSSSADETSIQHRRAGSLVALGAVFLVVMSLQSLTWMDMTRRLSNLIANANNACVSRTQIEWLKDTPLQHWSTDYYVVELQSQKPAVVMLEDNDCATLAATGKLRVGLSSQFRGPQDGWFDFSRVRPINPRP